MKRLSLFIVNYSLFTVLLSGCGGIDGPNVQYVEGTVTFKDAPLTKATVVFVPKISETESRGAVGITDENGKFTLTVTPHGPAGKGTTAGEYKVLITRKKDTPARFEKSDMGDIPVYDTLIPKTYGSVLHTTLDAIVEKKSKNEFKFNLKE
ncbi:hypothetical protein FACS18942_01150 [Planctomycetales bacterium]|nr:hypothetical protein FACS18942_01150 [Planctomycetales bacterium]